MAEEGGVDRAGDATGDAAPLASSLERNALALELLTAALVVLISPISFVFSPLSGVSVQVWLSTWVKYVFVFVVLAIGIAVGGFGVASTYRVRATAIRRTMRKKS